MRGSAASSESGLVGREMATARWASARSPRKTLSAPGKISSWSQGSWFRQVRSWRPLDNLWDTSLARIDPDSATCR